MFLFGRNCCNIIANPKSFLSFSLIGSCPIMINNLDGKCDDDDCVQVIRVEDQMRQNWYKHGPVAFMTHVEACLKIELPTYFYQSR